MFWTIYYGIATLWVAAGNSLVPNNFLTAAWWAVGIIALIPLALLIETPEKHKSRNCEEAEWYISNYKKIWFSKNPWNALSDYRITFRCYVSSDDYRQRMYKQLCDDVLDNLRRRTEGQPLIDTYLRAYHWMAINNSLNKIYEPKYQGVVNDVEKLRAWEPSMEINMG